LDQLDAKVTPSGLQHDEQADAYIDAIIEVL
jgi:hypothetical protein